MSLCKRISRNFVVLFLGIRGFESAYTSSRPERSINKSFEPTAQTDGRYYQFFHDLKGQSSNNAQERSALCDIISKNKTKAVIDAYGKSRGIRQKAAKDYKVLLKKAGETLATKRITRLTNYTASASFVASDAFGRHMTKRLMKIQSDNLEYGLMVAITKGEI